MKHAFRNLVASLSMLLLPVSATLAAQPMEEGMVAADEAAVAVVTIVGVDKASRTLTLKDASGEEWTFVAGPEVRNFDQIVRGDRVIISFYQGLALGLGPKGSGIEERIDAVRAERAALGQKPGAKVTRTTVAVGQIVAVNPKGRTVAIEGVRGTLVLGVAPDVDLGAVQVGQEVEALFVESFAVDVVPAPKVSGTVRIESRSIALGIGVEWGHGVLTMDDGSTHKFSIKGLSVLDLGISKVEMSGEVYGLVEAKDIEGLFASGEYGGALLGGGAYIAMKNRNGVVMQLKSEQEGVKLTLAAEGMQVKLAE